MKSRCFTLALITALSLSLGVAQAGQKNPAQQANKAQKQQAKSAPKVAPLAATVIKADAQSLTVKTDPMMGPDGLIPSQEKTYEATAGTVVLINGEIRQLTDLIASQPVHLKLSDDGKTVEGVESKFITPEAKAARKAIK
jgi:hypothetical protein